MPGKTVACKCSAAPVTAEVVVVKAHRTADPGTLVVEFGVLPGEPNDMDPPALTGWWMEVRRCQLQPGAPWPLRKSDVVTVVVPVATRAVRPRRPAPPPKPRRRLPVAPAG